MDSLRRFIPDNATLAEDLRRMRADPDFFRRIMGHRLYDERATQLECALAHAASRQHNQVR